MTTQSALLKAREALQAAIEYTANFWSVRYKAIEAIADLDRAIAEGVSALPNGWVAVPTIGAMVTSSHPQTCLNPDKVFEVIDVKCEHGSWYARGENTCWFGIGMLSAPPIATENASQEVGK